MADAAGGSVLPAERVERVVGAILDELLGAGAAGGVAPDEPLMSAGVNSTLAVALTERLEERLGVALPPTLVGGGDGLMLRLCCCFGHGFVP